MVLNASVQGDFTLFDGHSIVEDEELAFPLVGMIPYLVDLAGSEDLVKFTGKAEQQGFSKEDFSLLLDTAFFTLTKIRRELYGAVGLDLSKYGDPASIITSLTSMFEQERIGSRGALYHYKIHQTYPVPNCKLDLSRCSVSIDVDISLKFPTGKPEAVSISGNDPNAYDYQSFLDGMEIHFLKFKFDNSQASFDLSLEPRAIATVEFGHYRFSLDDSNQDKLIKNHTETENIVLDIHGQYTNTFMDEDGSEKVFSVEGSLQGNIGQLQFFADLPQDAVNGEIKKAKYGVQFETSY